MNYEQYYADETDSDDTFGWSDLMSESSASTTLVSIDEEFNDIIRNLENTMGFLTHAGNKNLFLL